MKIHTSGFKNAIKTFGRELDSKITYTIDGITTELGNEELNSVSPHYEGGILKSVMKQLDIDSNVEIPVGTEVNYQFGVKTYSDKNLFSCSMELGSLSNTTGNPEDNNNSIRTSDFISVESSTQYTISNDINYHIYYYEYDNNKGFIQYHGQNNNNYKSKVTFTTTATTKYIKVRTVGGNVENSLLGKWQLELGSTATSYDEYYGYKYLNFGNYIVKEAEKQEDLRSYKITCYDKMLYSMTDYENSNITYPITIRNYINAICTKLGITFANASDTFANYDKQIASELYLDSNGNSLGYTFRDVLDELAEVTASTICINDNDKLEIRYMNQTVGNNLFNYKETYSTPTNSTIESNDWITATYNNTNGSANAYCIYYSKIPNEVTIKEGTLYTIFLEIKNISYGSPNDYINITNNNANYISKTTLSNIALSGLTANGIYKYQITSKDNLTGVTGLLRTLVKVTTGSNVTLTYRLSLLEGNISLDDFKYEPYGDTIDEEFLRDINVNFGEQYGAINTIVLSRSAGADNIYYPSPLPLNPNEIKISDNQIMNGNDRDTYMADIYAKLNGLQYYLNDFLSTGICYLELCDKYNVRIGNNFYPCIMFNDNVNATQGLEENIYTDMPEESVTDYKKSDTTDRKINGAYIIANKVEAQIEEVTSRLNEATNTLDQVITTQDSTSRTIAILSTNIDADGNVNSVTTKEKRFTLNDNGLIITNSDTNYQSIQDETGTYYKDGNNIVGQYTKDGSKQKDLELFGIYSYGKNDINDNAMFVAQLYTDDNNEEAFGHFYNGGDL